MARVGVCHQKKKLFPLAGGMRRNVHRKYEPSPVPRDPGGNDVVTFSTRQNVMNRQHAKGGNRSFINNTLLSMQGMWALARVLLDSAAPAGGAGGVVIDKSEKAATIHLIMRSAISLSLLLLVGGFGLRIRSEPNPRTNRDNYRSRLLLSDGCGCSLSREGNCPRCGMIVGRYTGAN